MKRGKGGNWSKWNEEGVERFIDKKVKKIYEEEKRGF